MGSDDFFLELLRQTSTLLKIVGPGQLTHQPPWAQILQKFWTQLLLPLQYCVGCYGVPLEWCRHLVDCERELEIFKNNHLKIS
ncbi:hypothetical protein Pcinc_002078 [Petrolisthes cinctipes]|uniref:Uncharacterized protein n=1 Tax=Petrolisthes cinctipes TaxID=88211 RepID=A0AAE1GLN4_PETCI|nr:hypothetical protein Pcinc_022297 [Petrolisthes cinctipes]KAK3894137.1 hypothetical protein Pcinc_002078 [Petrolisthes cinctipes]